MSLDLDSRLRDYGTDVDTAIGTPAAGSVASTPARSRWVRYGVPAAAAALVAVATGVLIAGRGPEPSRPASGVTASTVAGPGTDYQVYFSPGDWEFMEPDRMAPIRLADGLVPWYELNDAAAEPFADSPVVPSSGLLLLACSGWEPDESGAIVCTDLESADEEPAFLYRDDGGRTVEITTAHDARMDASAFIYDQWYLENGNTAAPVEPIDIDGTDAWMATQGDGLWTVVAWSPDPATVVALETRGMTVEETTALVASVGAGSTANLPPLPLVLALVDGAAPTAETKRDDRLTGAVVDGEVCAFDSSHIVGDTADPCLSLRNDPMLLTLHGPAALPGHYAGLASGEVDLIRLDFEDGTQLTLRPTQQPVGEVQAFATEVSGPPATTVTALDDDGNELMTIDVASLNEQLTAPGGTEPAEG